MGSEFNWWKGKKGEWLVVIQVLLMLLVFLGPQSSEWFPDKRQFGVNTITGGVLILMLILSIFKLKTYLTPLPYPKEGGSLIRTGTYSIVRHPMYSGGILLAVGWVLVEENTLTLLYAIILFIFIDIKSRREERWLEERYPDYDDYKKQVKKLIPFIY